MIPRPKLSRTLLRQPQVVFGLCLGACLILSLALRLDAAASTSTETHTYTLPGGQTLVGQILGVAGDSVSLKGSDGTTKVVIANLSKDDQDYINQWQFKKAVASHAKFFEFDASENSPGYQKLPSGDARALLSYRVKLTNVSTFPLNHPIIQYIVASRSSLQLTHLTCDLTFGTVKPNSLAAGESLNILTDNALETDGDSKLLGIRVRITDSNNQLIQDWGNPPDMLNRVYAPFPKSGSGTSYNSHTQPGGAKGQGGEIVPPTYDHSFPMPGDP